MSGPERLERDEIEAVLETRRELGPSYEPALVDSFADRVEAAIAARVDAQLAVQHRVRAEDAAHGRRQLALGIVSLVAGIPITVLSLAVGNDAGLGALLVSWAGIGTVNATHAWRRRSRV